MTISLRFSPSQRFCVSLTSITSSLSQQLPLQSHYDISLSISSTFFLCTKNLLLYLASFLSSLSAASPLPPSQSASHCCLYGVVMVTIATVWRNGGWHIGGGGGGKKTIIACLKGLATTRWGTTLSNTSESSFSQSQTPMHEVHRNKDRNIYTTT